MKRILEGATAIGVALLLGGGPGGYGPAGAMADATVARAKPSGPCGGEAITGAPGSVVTGTPGHDVIVTNGSRLIRALGGDDCVIVAAANGEETEQDEIEVFLGGGDDILMHAGAGAESGPTTGRYVGGAGNDDLLLSSHTSMSINLRRRQAQSHQDGFHFKVLGWEGAAADSGTVRLTGTNRADALSASGCEVSVEGTGGDDVLRDAPWDVDSELRECEAPTSKRLLAGRGDDRIVGWTWQTDGVHYLGGPGRDEFALDRDPRVVGPREGRVVVDLAGGHAGATLKGTLVAAAELGGLENVAVDGSFGELRIIGTSAANRLRGAACRVVIVGGAGPDLLDLDGGETRHGCADRRYVARGEAGADELHGSDHDDLLVGGAGRDRALGREGVDTCRAEVEMSCER